MSQHYLSVILVFLTTFQATDGSAAMLIDEHGVNQLEPLKSLIRRTKIPPPQQIATSTGQISPTGEMSPQRSRQQGKSHILQSSKDPATTDSTQGGDAGADELAAGADEPAAGTGMSLMSLPRVSMSLPSCSSDCETKTSLCIDYHVCVGGKTVLEFKERCQIKKHLEEDCCPVDEAKASNPNAVATACTFSSAFDHRWAKISGEKPGVLPGGKTASAAQTNQCRADSKLVKHDCGADPPGDDSVTTDSKAATTTAGKKAEHSGGYANVAAIISAAVALVAFGSHN